MVKIIACDVDGTLADSDTEVSDEMLETIFKLQENYIFVTIGNGNYNRLYEQFIKKYSENTKNQLYFFPLGGLEGYISTSEGMIKLYSNDFSIEEKYEIIEKLSRFIEYEKLIPCTYDQIEDRGSMICLAPIGNKAPKQAKIDWDPDKLKRRRMIADLKFTYKLNKYNLTIGGTTHIDITKKGFDKSYGIQKIKELFNVEYDDILFFGDDLQEGGNDHAVTKHLNSTVSVNNPMETLIKFKEILNE